VGSPSLGRLLPSTSPGFRIGNPYSEHKAIIPVLEWNNTDGFPGTRLNGRARRLRVVAAPSGGPRLRAETEPAADVEFSPLMIQGSPG
jgi:hypothetical protein